jgi:hypothetical protein
MAHPVQTFRKAVSRLHEAQAAHGADVKTLRGREAKLGADRTKLKHDLDAFDPRPQIADDRHAVAVDLTSVHGAKVAAARSHKTERGALHRALQALTPAEYTMNLQQTNAARREVGLGAVNHTIRPGQISPQGSNEMHHLVQIAASYASGRRPMGWCLKKVEDYLDQATYGKIGHGHIPRFAMAHQFADYLNAGHRYEQLGLKKLDLDNPYAAPPGSIIVVRAGTPGTHNPVAGDIVVRGYGDHFYNDGEMGYGGPGNFPKGNHHVLGIYTPQ